MHIVFTHGSKNYRSTLVRVVVCHIYADDVDDDEDVDVVVDDAVNVNVDDVHVHDVFDVDVLCSGGGGKGGPPSIAD